MYRAWLLRTGELVFEARSGMWVRDCDGYVKPYPHQHQASNGGRVAPLPHLLPDADELTQRVRND